MSEVNEGVGIILARMESHPEEFFGLGETNSKWRWIFSENLREVMTEPEKAALHSGMTKVRRLEITHKAIATIMPAEEEEEKEYRYKGKGLTATTADLSQVQPKKMVVSASQMEMMKRMSGGFK
jgi:NCAIR mutase (PurE)-related protein